MNPIIESTDHRLLRTIAEGGASLLGYYWMIVSEMQRLGTATLSYGQWQDIVRLVIRLDREDYYEVTDASNIVEDLVNFGLLEIEADMPVLSAQAITSPEMAVYLAQKERASEVARKAATARWAAKE